MPEPALSVTLLGTGTSTGVPVIGCACRVCTSDDPRDTRLRTAAHVTVHSDAGPIHLQLDAGPDFRTQALRFGLTRVDAMLVTHHHFDHVAALDDLRPFFFDNRAPIPLFAPDNTAEVLARGFPYLFDGGAYPGAPRYALSALPTDASEPFEVGSRYHEGSVRVTPLPALHGPLALLGYRVGRFAYLTDVSRVPATTLSLLGGLDVLVLDALRPEPHPTHLSFDEAVALAGRIGARQTYFVHMSHNVRHEEQNARLPDRVALGYDGLRIDVAGGAESHGAAPERRR